MGNRHGDAACANSNWHILVGMGPDEHAKTIGKMLKEQRQKYARRGDPIHQQVIGEAAGVTQSYISRVEKGERSLQGMPGEQLLKFLRAYRFDTLKIKGIIREFELSYPRELDEGDDDQPPGMVDVLYEGTVTTEVKPPQTRKITAAFIEGHDPDVIRLRDVQASDLATPAAAREVSPNSYLVLEINKTACTGQMCLYELPDGRTVLGVAGRAEEWALPLDSDGDPVRMTGARITRAVIGVYKRHGPV